VSTLRTTIKIEGLSDAVKRLKAADKKLAEEVAPVVEMAAMEAVQTHLDSNYVGKANQLGGQSTGYWTGVRNSAAAEQKGNGVTITLKGAGLLMKWEGGTIKPSGRISSATGKPIKWLTIPVAPEAHGKVAAMFGNRLYTHRFAGGTGQSLGDTRQGGGLWLRTGSQSSDSDPLLFWFLKSVTIKPDHNILPPADQTGKACAEAVKLMLETV
jgi:hypothetical protein